MNQQITQKTLLASIALTLAAGVGTYGIEQVKTRSSSHATATLAPPASDRTEFAETGILKAPDGKPLANAEVYLSTASVTVPIYSVPPPNVSVTRTAADGRFSFA